jgi:biotin carboxylase
MTDSKVKPVALVLGGTLPHCELIKNLQGRGYYVVLIDYLDVPPAAAIADEHLRESTLDKEMVLEIARSQNADLVISTCIDQANVTACYVMEQLGLPAPYSYETALLVSNKVLMKRRMLECAIPTSSFVEIESIEGLVGHGLKFPVIVKPADCNSSKGVRFAQNDPDLFIFAEDALKISRSGHAVVEEFVEGIEIGIDCFVYSDKTQVLVTKERRKFKKGDWGVEQIYGCVWPSVPPNTNINDLTEVADKIANAFGLKNTPLMIQAIVTDAGINIIEFAPRIGGGESFRLIKKLTGFDYVDAAVDSFLGNNPSQAIHEASEIYSDNFIYAKPRQFGKISGHDALLEDGTIEYIDCYREPGTIIGAELTSNNRVGVFVVKAENLDELNKKIERAQVAIEVYDIDGLSMMRRDIYG